MTTTKEKLLKILNQYPDEAAIMIYDGCSYNDIGSITIEYVCGDDYSMPQINLNIKEY